MEGWDEGREVGSRKLRIEGKKEFNAEGTETAEGAERIGNSKLETRNTKLVEEIGVREPSQIIRNKEAGERRRESGCQMKRDFITHKDHAWSSNAKCKRGEISL